MSRILSVDSPHIYELLFIIILLSGCSAAQGISDKNLNKDIQQSEKPYVISTYPSPGDFHISQYTDIRIRFNKEMKDASFELLDRGKRIEGEGRWTDSRRMFIFQPYDSLKKGTTYQCILKEGIDMDGRRTVNTPYIWFFTTAKGG